MQPPVTGGFRDIRVELKTAQERRSLQPVISRLQSTSPPGEAKQLPSKNEGGVSSSDKALNENPSPRSVSTDPTSPSRKAHKTFAQFQKSLQRELKQRNSETQKVEFKSPPVSKKAFPEMGEQTSTIHYSLRSRSYDPTVPRPSILKVRSLDKGTRQKDRKVSFSLVNQIHEVECLKHWNRQAAETPTFDSKRKEKEGCVIF